ncbi:3'-5' exonuclease [Pseudomonas sp. LS44]|uniref:3'-5' exonuclease n=1 Tax=Pseudomonas sp. LS44 TaxID=1357074 RepID=UPI00215B28F6|nr:3'-5' exonuclease [Pseudomonas sp. LS44]UVE18188.1 3'-5' exonuclease [Pseudomonas sp. LS44]
MSMLAWLQRRRPLLSAVQQQRLATLPVAPPLDSRPLCTQRLVVLDLETSGLNMRRDQVLAVGAVVIENGAIDLAQQFECTLQATAQIGPSVLIHGLGPSELAAGVDPTEALLGFLEFLGSSSLLAFHAGFDQRMLGRALKQVLGLRLQRHFFDVAELAPLLCPQAQLRNAGLDDWAGYFGLHAHQRHHASADALLTAEIALILFNRARSHDLDSLVALEQRLQHWRRRQRTPSF